MAQAAAATAAGSTGNLMRQSVLERLPAFVYCLMREREASKFQETSLEQSPNSQLFAVHP